ncbi:MAG: RnfABCDGE type electron transport complex subunit D [Ilumatobacteraceae bacterium]
MSSHTLTLGPRTYPVVLPNIRDSRLHVAAVIVTIHVLGQTTLRFHISVPQILAAILTCAVIEVALTFHSSRSLVWPASAMLTGSGVALILRVPSTPPGDHWSTHAWYVFAGVAALSLLTKYLIRFRGSHVFNPSNVGLVVAFIVLGSTRIEPLDFWWAPLHRGMLAAYVVILVGGVLVTRRLELLAAAATFWVTLAAGVGVLAASGHCMIARWAFAPVCGFDYWRVIVTSPEVLIFLFFMITDPKTVPASRHGRLVFAALVGITSTLLMAPQTNEFGTKVGLLGGLAVVCACRPVVARLAPASRRRTDDPRRWVGSPARALVPAGVLLLTVVVGAGAIVVAGTPARGTLVPATADVIGRAPLDVDPATLPTISVDQDVLDWNHEISGAGAQEIVLTLAENLQLEHQALRHADTAALEAVDHGDRLDDMRDRIRVAAADGTTVVDSYRIDDVDVTLIVPFGKQAGLSLGLESRGMVTTETFGRDGSLHSRTSAPFATTFVVGRPTGGRWLIVAELPADAGT